MKATLDNNVLVSAIISPLGVPGLILAAWRRGDFQLVISAPLLLELARVLAYPRIVRRTGWSSEQQQEFVQLVAADGLLVEPEVEVALSRDPDDNRVLEAAGAGKADYIVSGDQDLLVLQSFDAIPIVTPSRFLALLK